MTRALLIALILVPMSLGLSPRFEGTSGPEPSPELTNSPVAKMVGTWEGEAWFQTGPEKKFVKQREVVEWRMSKNVIVIEGRGDVVDAQTPEEKIGHNAMAIVRFDKKSGTTRFHAFKLDADPIDVELETLADGTMRWAFNPVPGVSVRFTIRLDDSTWVETGEMSADSGKTWRKYLEMNLKRVE